MKGFTLIELMVVVAVIAILVGGAIQLTFGNQAIAAIKGKTLTLRPAIVEDAKIVPVAWVCGHARAPDQMTVQSTHLTDVDKHLLPINCRAG